MNETVEITKVGHCSSCSIQSIRVTETLDLLGQATYTEVIIALLYSCNFITGDCYCFV